ncbi:Cyclin-A2 [Halotydeus destructor]|nr:Cyclin-A2 [Halotydeus destructor]
MNMASDSRGDANTHAMKSMVNDENGMPVKRLESRQPLGNKIFHGNARPALGDVAHADNKKVEASKNVFLSKAETVQNQAPSANLLRNVQKAQPPKFSIYCDEGHDRTEGVGHDLEESFMDDKENLTISPKYDSLDDDSLYMKEEGGDVSHVMLTAEKSIIETGKPLSAADRLSEKNHLNFVEYTIDVHTYLLNFERKFKSDALYMERQAEINWKMRSILVDWLVEVSDEYKLQDETMFLAVNLIDRFLTCMSITRQSFQLLGTAALFVSSKYEEIYPPEIRDFVYITDDSYTKYQVLSMEKLILKSLQFNVSVPTSHYFLQKFLSQLNLTEPVTHMAQYLVYLTLLDGSQFLKFWPSELALASIILAARTFSHNLSTDVMETIYKIESEVSGESLEILEHRRAVCLETLADLKRTASVHPQQAIYNKFSEDKYSGVALIEADDDGDITI